MKQIVLICTISLLSVGSIRCASAEQFISALKAFDTDMANNLGAQSTVGAQTGDPIDQATQLIKVVGDLDEAQNRIGILNGHLRRIEGELLTLKAVIDFDEAEARRKDEILQNNSAYRTTFAEWYTKRKQILADKQKQIESLTLQLQQKKAGGDVGASPEFKSRRATIEAAFGGAQPTTPRPAAQASMHRRPTVSGIAPKAAPVGPPSAPAFLTECVEPAVVSGRRGTMPAAPTFVRPEREMRERAAIFEQALRDIKRALASSVSNDQKVQNIEKIVESTNV